MSVPGHVLAGARPFAAAHVLLRRPAARAVVALAFFALLTVVALWPVASRPGSAVLGTFSDATLVMHDYWSMEQTGTTPFTSDHDPTNGAPEGRPRAPATQIASPVQPAFVWAVKPALGIVAAVNVFMLLGFVLTGFAAFLLVERHGFGFLPGLFAGSLVAFNPWMIERAYSGHVGFAHGWCLVVLVAALVRLLDRRTIAAAALAGAAYGLCFLVAAYFALLATPIVAAFMIVDLVRGASWSDRLWTFTLLTAIGAVTVLALLPGLAAFATDRAATTDTLSRTLEWLTEGAATIESYVLPAPRHPVLGTFGAEHRPDDPFSEKVLYFGLTTIALAAAAVVLALRDRRRGRGPLSDRQRLLVVLAATCVPLAFYASLPRDVELLGLRLPTPAFLIGEITTFYRVYARIGYVVGIGLAVLAAVTLARLSRRPAGAAAAVALAALAVFELLPGRPTATAIDTPPRHDAWLARQPPGIVAHYPLITSKKPAELLAAREIYYQRFTEKPLFTAYGATAGSREEAIRAVARDLRRRDARRVLATEGVRYVVVHADVYRAQGEAPPFLGISRRLARFGDVRVYGVRERPLDLDRLLERRADEIAQLWLIEPVALSVPGRGFHGEEPFDPSTGPWRWLFQGGELRISNPNEERVRVRLSFKAFSNLRARSLSLRDTRGRVLARTEVPPQLAELTLGPFRVEPGETRLRLTAAPPPEPLGGADERQASVFLSPIAPSTLADFPPANRRGGS